MRRALSCTTVSVVDPTPTDTREMNVVHAAIRREFRLAPEVVRRVGDGDVARARTVAGHLGMLLDVLHHHHEGEDELLWPLLRRRVPDPGPLDRAEAQHAAIGAEVAAVSALLPVWRAGPARRAALVDGLVRLHDLLVEHLEDEERELLPLVAAHVTPAEWHAVGEAARTATPARQRLVVFGLLAYEADPAVIASMLGDAPRPVRVGLGVLAPRAYARYARRIHGTSTP